MYIDTHCHLTFPQFDEDRAMVIGNAKKVGVKKFITPGVDIYSSRQSVELAQKNPGVIFAAVGIHPYEAQHNPNIKDLESLLSIVNKEQHVIVAIGECGLDYHLYKGEKALGKKDNQKRLFLDQLELAVKYHLPVIIHCRDGTSNVPAASDGGAFDDLFDVLDSLPSLPNGVLHCFSGGLQEVREAVKRRLYLGIDGNVTYSKHLEFTVPQIPLSHLMIETDAPYLTPVPNRGKRNEPKFLPFTAKKIAQLQNIKEFEVETRTTENAYSLFNLPRI